MIDSRDPAWLRALSRHLGWLAVPNIAILLITLQVLGFFMVMSEPVWFDRLALLPDRVFAGEIWRVVTFLALPLSSGIIWMIFSLWFLYFILNTLEAEWGDFKTTLYLLVSVGVTIAFSLAFGYPVLSCSDIVSTLFLAVAALYPEMEIRLYMVVPVKMKFMGWLALAFVAYRFATGAWIDRAFLLAIYSNYLLFFGPSMVSRARDWKRRRDYRAKLRD
jgi:hypothetical protein